MSTIEKNLSTLSNGANHQKKLIIPARMHEVAFKETQATKLADSFCSRYVGNPSLIVEAQTHIKNANVFVLRALTETLLDITTSKPEASLKKNAGALLIEVFSQLKEPNFIKNQLLNTLKLQQAKPDPPTMNTLLTLNSKIIPFLPMEQQTLLDLEDVYYLPLRNLQKQTKEKTFSQKFDEIKQNLQEAILLDFSTSLLPEFMGKVLVFRLEDSKIGSQKIASLLKCSPKKINGAIDQLIVLGYLTDRKNLSVEARVVRQQLPTLLKTMTYDQISKYIGVSRSSIYEAALELKKRGILPEELTELSDPMGPNPLSPEAAARAFENFVEKLILDNPSATNDELFALACMMDPQFKKKATRNKMMNTMLTSALSSRANKIRARIKKAAKETTF